MTRLIDATALAESVEGTTMSAEQRNLFKALINAQPRVGYEEDEVSKMQNEIEYWRKLCDRYEHAILIMAVRETEREGV